MLTFSEDILEISEEEIEKYREKVKNFIIPDPNDELIEIYEIDKLINLIGIRAEKYYSPEYHTELEELRKKWMNDKSKEKEFKIPRGIQNENYTELLEILESIRKARKKESQVLKDKIRNLFIFLLKFQGKIGKDLIINNDHQVQKINHDLDIRLIESLEMYLNYLYTKYNLN